jgi:hypothetical protein
MDSVSPMSHFHLPHRLPAQFSRVLAADLVPLLILECPCPLQRVESDPDDLPRPRHADVVRPVVHRDLAPSLHSTWHAMHPDQFPDLPQIPARLLPGQVVGTSGVLQARMGLQAGSASHARITLALHPVHDFQTLLQLDARPAGPGLAPPLADPLRPFHHPVVLGGSGRIGGHLDVQPRQPADQVGGQVASRSPGRAVVDSQSLGATPPLKRMPQGRLGLSRIDLGPVSEGGKHPSAGQPRSPRRRSEASRPRTCPRSGCAPRRRSARSDADARLERRSRTPIRADGRPGPGRGRRSGTIGESPGGWARRPEADRRRASRGSIPPPRSGDRDARRGPPVGPHRDRHDRASRGRDSRGEGRKSPARGPASGDVARCVARDRRIPPARPRIRPDRLVPRFSDARGWGQAWASRSPPRQGREDQGCSPISSRDPSLGKTSGSD